MEAVKEEVVLETKKSRNEEDKELCKSYFKGLDDVLEKLEGELGYIMVKCFDIVRKEPEKLVTAVRIIEREEHYDLYLLEQQRKMGYLPHNRPRGWRKMFFDKLRDDIFQKVEGNQLESRDENKMWLVRHLEAIRQI